MKILAVDIGNTLSKIALMSDYAVISVHRSSEIIPADFIELINKEKDITHSIICSTRIIGNELLNAILQCGVKNIILDGHTLCPVDNMYESASTLGPDRIANAVGGRYLFPDSNVLVIDIGSAITYDFINDKNKYLGGSISPGLNMRFNSLNYYTEKLPRINQVSIPESMIGANTNDSILTGVVNGIVHELNGFIQSYTAIYKNTKVIITGGDAPLFEKSIKSAIFAEPNVLFIGLYQILKYNAEN